MKAVIVGGGIGGLTTALSFHAAGMDAVIYESIAEVKGLGLGINLQPNAVRELFELGLEEELYSVAVETTFLAYYNKHGQLIWREPRGKGAGYRWPQFAINRGDLLMLLLDAVKKRLGPASYVTGHHFVNFEQDGFGVTAQFVERSTGRALPSQRGDVLIAADGIHSSVRRILYPKEGAPVFSGRMIWRGKIEAEPYLDGRTQVMIGHRDQRAVIYPMSEELRKRGNSLINWAVVLGGRYNEDEREVWDRLALKERFIRHFQDWNFEWIKFRDLMSATQEIFEYPKSDRDPLPHWTFGRVTLMGDAAHPMRPVGSQAGTQAVVDARVLANKLAEASTPQAGLEAYQAERLPPMNAVILTNREFGPEIVMQMVEERAPSGFDNIETIIPRSELERIAREFKVTAGIEPHTLNARRSHTVDLRKS